MSPAAAEQRISFIDSHTGGEPTRVIVSGGPDLGGGPLPDRRRRFAEQFDTLRSAMVNEPRGSDVLVGALLLEPHDPRCSAGVIFFNNVGTLGMCGHGSIGLAVTLGRLGRWAEGVHRLDTPVGPVVVQYDGRHRASIENVPSYRLRKDVAVEVPGFGSVRGDIAWGGNWFYLVSRHDCDLQVRHAAELTRFCIAIRDALGSAGHTGPDGSPIDHIELFGPPINGDNHSRNFVLCPGSAYDRSPCGTGTSAKIACLAADGKLAPEAVWRQESIIGSVFEATYRFDADRVIPTITGSAYVSAEGSLIIDPEDPLRMGIRA